MCRVYRPILKSVLPCRARPCCSVEPACRAEAAPSRTAKGDGSTSRGTASTLHNKLLIAMGETGLVQSLKPALSPTARAKMLQGRPGCCSLICLGFEELSRNLLSFGGVILVPRKLVGRPHSDLFTFPFGIAISHEKLVHFFVKFYFFVSHGSPFRSL